MKTTFERLQKILIDQLGLKSWPALESHLEVDLGADSLDAVEITMAVEEEFGINIPDEDGDQWKTVGDILSYLKEHLRDFQP